MGSNLCDELVKDNHVICLDNFVSGFESNIDHLLSHPNFRFLRHDVTEPMDLEGARELESFNIRFQGIQEIYHLACPHSPAQYSEQEEATLLANTAGMRNVLEIAKKYKSRFLHFSSSVVYGPRPSDNHPFKEEDIGHVDHLSARSVYDEGKRIAETIVAYYARVHRLDAKAIRLFRTYGPRMPLTRGHMIPDLALAALEGRDLALEGDKSFDTSMCYVGDAVDAAQRAMKAKAGLGFVNIGSPEVISFRAIAEKLIKISASKSKITQKEGHLLMSSLGIPDVAKAKKLLGWMPLIGIDKGLEMTMEYIKAQKSLLHL